ncbi:hypothetical protein Jab_2c01390 [Janthinobacterium sp. HH01]|uniref:hypothetical protein n=1 Tax=Janthinobacterium sp. HH01 TaxID=1198452 RepID=UPI0002AE9C34|nr:hypothetical protein [Janthinobacterium sp. HH01]ELX08094.1 hypothetical protein Jab_2c01390 [Janthinobacterium sp. HH01]
MRNTFFANIKKALTASTTEAHQAAVEKSLSTNTLAGIQNLSIKEYSAVAGGPQVENDPQG